MLFILLMEALHRVFQQAARNGVLAPPASTTIHHQCSLYADDIVLFVAPTVQDLILTKEIMNFFSSCSKLWMNLQKSLITPIACSQEDINRVKEIFPA